MVNPILPEQEGTNRYDLTDKNGVKIIQSIMKTAESGGGFNEFYFTKSDGKTVAPKVAYSKKLSYEKINQPPGKIFITWRLVLFMVSVIIVPLLSKRKYYVHLFLVIFLLCC